MQVDKVRCLKDYQSLVNHYSNELLILKAYEQKLTDRFFNHGDFFVDGFSWPIQQSSTFLVDGLYGSESELNFRERLVCVKTNLNNRIRAAIHLFSLLLQPQSDDLIYITEQLTPLYRWLHKNYVNVTGSEYLTDTNWLQWLKFRMKLFPEKIAHQDLTQLTFEDEQINHVLSFDCFEHIPNYLNAFKEVFRVLKPSGKFMFSVPFDLNNAENLTRATIQDDGNIIHHVEADYHGDPISSQGILSYYTFGWQVLEELKSVGFKDAYGAVYWSKEMVYLGGAQVMICAEK